MSNVTLLESFFLKPGEQIIREEEVKYEGGLTFQSKKVKGILRLTNGRIIFISNKNELGKNEKVIINMTLDKLLLGETEKSLLGSVLSRTGFTNISKHYTIFSYEDLYGVMQKPKFKSANAIEWAETIKLVASRVQKTGEQIYETRKKIEEFKNFTTFLSIEKFIRPIYFDPVSRVLQISSERIFISDNWEAEGSQDITRNLEEWIDTFKEKDVASRWLMHRR